MPRQTGLNVKKMRSEFFELLRSKWYSENGFDYECTESRLMTYYKQMEDKQQIVDSLMQCDIFDKSLLQAESKEKRTKLCKSIANTCLRFDNPIKGELKNHGKNFFRATLHKLLEEIENVQVPAGNVKNTHDAVDRVNYTAYYLLNEAKNATIKELCYKNEKIISSNFDQAMRNSTFRAFREIVFRSTERLEALFQKYYYYGFNPMEACHWTEYYILEKTRVCTILAYMPRTALPPGKCARSSSDGNRIPSMPRGIGTGQAKHYNELAETQSEESFAYLEERQVNMQNSSQSSQYGNFFVARAPSINPYDTQSTNATGFAANQPTSNYDNQCYNAAGNEQEPSYSSLQMQVITSEKSNGTDESATLPRLG